jgi:hypothetical protein
VVEGQLATGHVAADEQVKPPGGGGQPRPFAGSPARVSARGLDG